MTPQLIVILLGLVLTPLISWLKSENWSDQNKQRFAIIMAAVAGLLVNQFAPGTTLDLNNYLQAMLLLVGTNQLAFQAVMKGLGLENLFDLLKGVKAPTQTPSS